MGSSGINAGTWGLYVWDGHGEVSVSHPSIHRLISGTSTSAKMGKIMKSGKVVLILAGRFAGRKAIIVKNYDDSTHEKPSGHALVAGVDRYPRKMTKKKVAKRSKIKSFVKIVNYNHMMPTHYSVDLNFDKNMINKESIKDPLKRKKARFAVRTKFEERYKLGKNRWFFSKLRF